MAGLALGTSWLFAVMKIIWNRICALKRSAFVVIITLLTAVSLAIPVLRLYRDTHGTAAYCDRPLEIWLRELGNRDWAVRKKAEEAVKHFGAAAIPKVIELLRAREEFPRSRVLDYAERWACLRVYLLSAAELQDCAVIACRILGPSAKPAIPELIRVLSERPSENIAVALAAMGRDVIPALIALLLDSDVEVRVCSAFAVGRLYAVEVEGNRYLDDPKQLNPPKPEAAARRMAVNALIANLEHQEPRVRAVSGWALGKLGEPARAAVPSLVKALSDRDPVVRGAAVQALRLLDPAPLAIEEPQSFPRLPSVITDRNLLFEPLK